MKKYAIALFVALPLAVFSLVGHAEECTTVEQLYRVSCIKASSNKAEQDLSRTYRAVLKTFDNDDDNRSAFIAAQRQWVAFKEADCQVMSEYAPMRTDSVLLFMQCTTERARDRQRELEHFLKDLSWP